MAPDHASPTATPAQDGVDLRALCADAGVFELLDGLER